MSSFNYKLNFIFMCFVVLVNTSAIALVLGAGTVAQKSGAYLLTSPYPAFGLASLMIGSFFVTIIFIIRFFRLAQDQRE